MIWLGRLMEGGRRREVVRRKEEREGDREGGRRGTRSQGSVLKMKC